MGRFQSILNRYINALSYLPFGLENMFTSTFRANVWFVGFEASATNETTESANSPDEDSLLNNDSLNSGFNKIDLNTSSAGLNGVSLGHFKTFKS